MNIQKWERQEYPTSPENNQLATKPALQISSYIKSDPHPAHGRDAIR